MVDQIGPIMPQPIEPGKGSKADPNAPVKGKSFQDVFKEQIEAVNKLKQEADAKQADLVAGRTDNVVEVLDAVEKADLAFQALMEVRNNLVDAYEEISRMRI